VFTATQTLKKRPLSSALLEILVKMKPPPFKQHGNGGVVQLLELLALGVTSKM